MIGTETVEEYFVILEITFCFNRKPFMSNNMENIFIDPLFPKTKPISVGIINKPLSQTQFLEWFQSLRHSTLKQNLRSWRL